MKTALATTLLAALAGQALSQAVFIGVRNTEFKAAAEDKRIVFQGPDDFNPEQGQWTFLAPEPATGDTTLIQHVATEQYVECSLGQSECVLSENGTLFTAYEADFDNGVFVVGVEVGGDEDWVLEAGDALHLATPAEEVNAQWFTFPAAEPEEE